jgi:hypothetical protein
MTLWVRMLPILMALAMSREGWAQTQYQQAQFPGANVNFNFQDVSWLAVAPGDNIYMLQRAGADVSVWSPAGQVLAQWWMDELQYPHSLRIQNDADGEHIWVTDMVPPGIQAGPGVVPRGHCVKEFSQSDRRLGTIGTCGEGGTGLDPVQFDKVTDIAFDSQGLRWISDGDLGGLNNRVLQLDRNGKVLQVWSAPGNQPGSGPREFNLPHALDIDSCDRVFVADTLNHRVQVIRTDGTVLQQLQCFGSDGVYGLRLTKANASGRLQLATTSSPTQNPTGGAVRLFNVAANCTAPKPVLDDCTTAAQWDIALPPSPMTGMLHSVDVDSTGGIYIATLGGNLPPQKWVPVSSPKATAVPR